MPAATDALLPTEGDAAGLAVDSDAELMLRFQAGDRACFDPLFEKYKGPLVHFAYRFTGRRDVAEELAQDILVKCYMGAASYQPSAKFSTWLFRIARNHCLNSVRRGEHRKETRPLADAAEPTGGESPEAALEGRAVQEAALEAVAALPEAQRTALLLSRTQSMSYEEIATTMGTSVSAVKSLLNRAKCALKERLAALVENVHEM